MWTCDDIRICDLTPPTRFDYCWKFPKKKFFWLNRSILLIFRKKNKQTQQNCKQKKEPEKACLVFLLCWKSTTRFQTPHQHQIKLRIFCRRDFVQIFTRCGIEIRIPLKKLRRCELIAFLVTLKAYLPKFFCHLSTATPWNRHLIIDNKSKKTFKVINSNWFHDRREVIEFPQLSREMISQLI